MGREKEWVREEKKKKGLREQEDEQQSKQEGVRNEERKREGKETKPGDPAEAPKTEQEKEWEAAAAAALPPFSSTIPANCANAEGFHHFRFFWGDFLI